jgi:hypothetical protein
MQPNQPLTALLYNLPRLPVLAVSCAFPVLTVSALWNFDMCKADDPE